ncbi:hypothetical protein GJV07_16415 [Enterobacteriaceae bacterium RIT711]|nr:hypothetical protein [Enterobacteriaceae bacterium RIT711]
MTKFKKRWMFILSITVLCLIFSDYSFSAARYCRGTYSSIGGDYTATTSNMVAPGSNETYKLLYTLDNVTINAAYADCRVGNWITTVQALIDVPPGQVVSYNGENIYPTNIQGLGMSITEAFTGSKMAIPVWPENVSAGNRYDNYTTPMKFNLKLWIMPGFVPPTGMTQVNSFTVVTLIRPFDAVNDYLETCPPDAIRLDGNNKFCALITRRISLSVLFQPSTCELLTENQRVDMGIYHTTDNINNSSWVDATFQLKCSQALGYNGSIKNPSNNYNADNGARSANTVGNQPVRIKIVPFNPITDALQGTFELDQGGAKGYSLQLAWGDPASQGNTPAKPVQLGSWVNASTLNSNYSSTAYAIGANPIPTGADGKIKMSARYLRNTDEVEPGVANASVEVIATYN